MFLLRCRPGLTVWSVGGVVVVGCWWPLLSRASLYAGNAFSYSSTLQDSDAILLVMVWGSCFKMLGGWLDPTWTYCSSLLGFLNGQYLPVVMSSVTSRKSVWGSKVSIVTCRPWDLKILFKLDRFVHIFYRFYCIMI